METDEISKIILWLNKRGNVTDAIKLQFEVDVLKQRAEKAEAENANIKRILQSLLLDCEMTAMQKGYHPEDFDNIQEARAVLEKKS